MITIAGYAADRYIIPPQCGLAHRSRSVAYTLDGGAREDRLGKYKKTLILTFGLLPSDMWEGLKKKLQEKVIPVSGSLCGMDVNGDYRMTDDAIPTPLLVLTGGRYYCQTFSISLEEI